MRTNTGHSFFLFALIAGFEVAPVERARADGDAVHILGYVRDSDGNPVAGVDVIGDDYVGGVQTFTTEADGFYEIEGEPEVNLRVQVSCEQLNARGFSCVPPAAVTLSADDVRVDFVVYPIDSPLQIASSILPRGNAGMFYSTHLGANGGTPPYNWQLAPDSPALPAGLALSPGGVISGTPASSAVSSIKVQVTDSTFAVTNKVFSFVINPRPILSAPVWRTNRFSMVLTGATNQNYTIQVCTDLNGASWTSLFVTNHPNASSYVVIDPQAGSRERFYRVLIGP